MPDRAPQNIPSAPVHREEATADMTDTTAPLLLSTSPVDDATNVSPFANLVLTFDEAVKAGSGNIEIRRSSDASIAMSIAVTDVSQISFSGNQLTVNPSGF